MKQYDKQFTERLRQSVFNTNKSINQVSRETGLATSQLSLYLNTGMLPNTANLKRLCKYLNVSADWLLGLEDNHEIKNVMK